jgi:LPS export ABC transporter protein LptC
MLQHPTWPMRGNLKPFAALLSGVAALLAGCGGGASDSAGTGSAERLRDPGYSLKDAEITETNDQGQPRYTVSAAHAEQDPASGEISLDAIHMKLRDQRGSEWFMRARSGRMPEDASTVALRGAVILDGTLGKANEALQLRTEALDVDTRTEKVSTKMPVIIAMSGRELAARGLKADLKDRRVQLESNVHGRFTP